MKHHQGDMLGSTLLSEPHRQGAEPTPATQRWEPELTRTSAHTRGHPRLARSCVGGLPCWSLRINCRADQKPLLSPHHFLGEVGGPSLPRLSIEESRLVVAGAQLCSTHCLKAPTAQRPRLLQRRSPKNQSPQGKVCLQGPCFLA